MGIHEPIAYACGCKDHSELAIIIIITTERRDGLRYPVTMNGDIVWTYETFNVLVDVFLVAFGCTILGIWYVFLTLCTYQAPVYFTERRP